MQYVKKWKKYIAGLLAFAMLISNFTPSLQTIYAQSNDEEISSIELQQDEIQLNENQLEVITPDNNVEMELQPEDIQLDENQSEVTTSDNNSEMESEVDTSTLIIHYNRANNDYDGWNIHTWNTGIEGDTYEFTGEDEFGKIATLEVLTGNEVGYIIKKGDWEDKNHSDDQFVTVEEDMEIWVIQGQNGYYESKPSLDEVYPDDSNDETPLDLVVHYERTNADYDAFKLYTWGTSGDTHQNFDYDDSYGKTKLFSFDNLQNVKDFGFIIYEQVEGKEWHENKDGGDKKNINIDELKLVKNADKYVAHIYVKQGSDEIHYENPNKETGTYSTVTLHFNRQDNDYTNWDLWVWDTGSEDGAHAFEYEDDFGRVIEFKVKTGNNLGYIVRKSDWSEKNHGDDQRLQVLGDTEIWVNEGQNGFDAVGPSGNRKELPQAPVVDIVPDEEAELQIFVHYYRYLEDYKNWNVWSWGEGQEGYGYPFVETDGFGKVAKINLKDLNDIEKMGFIIRKGEWAAKDIDKDRFIDLTKAVEVNGKKQLHVYLLQSEEMVYYTSKVDKTPALSGATFTDLNQLKVTAPVTFEDTDGVVVKDVNEKDLAIEKIELSKDSKWLTVTLKDNIQMGETYTVEKTGFRAPAVIEYYGVYDSDAFNDLFYYDGDDLGATYSKESTTFKVWAPTASEVNLQRYQTGHKDESPLETAMT